MKHRGHQIVVSVFAFGLLAGMISRTLKAEPDLPSVAAPQPNAPTDGPEATVPSAPTAIVSTAGPIAGVGAGPNPSAGASATPPGFPGPGAVSPTSAPPVPPLDYAKVSQGLDATLNDLLDIPETPATYAIGLSTETVAHPGTLRDAVAQVSSYFSSGGAIKPGLAVEAAPFRPLFVKYDIDSWMKQASRWHHLLDGFRLSIATAADPTAAVGSTAPTLISMGARLSLWDDRDYRHNVGFVKATRRALKKCFPAGPVTPGPGGANFTSIAVDTECGKQLSKVMDYLESTLARGHRLEVASIVSVAQRQPANQVDWRATKGWLAYDYAFGIGTLGGASTLEWQDNPTGRRTSSMSLGARFSVGGAHVKWTSALLYGKFGIDQNRSDDMVKFGGTITLRLRSLGFLGVGVQGTRDFDAKASQATALVSLTTSNDESMFSKAFATSTIRP